MITSEFDTPSVAHLTCVGRTHADIAARSMKYRTAGVENVLALRGDLPLARPRTTSPPPTTLRPRPHPRACRRRLLCGRRSYPRATLPVRDLNASVEHLKQKQDAGASFFVTQLFFDNECFYRFRELADKTGITVPITAGIMPFMGKSRSAAWSLCAARRCPPRHQDSRQVTRTTPSLQAAGVDYAARQLCDLKEHGADGLHLYTMNRPAIAATIMERL